MAPPPETATEKAVEKAPVDPKTEATPAEVNWLKGLPITMQHFRPLNRPGINVFKTPKEPGVVHTVSKLDWGAAFTSQIQSLSHSNSAVPNMVNAVNAKNSPTSGSASITRRRTCT